MPQFPQGLCLNLPNPFSGNVEILSDLFQGMSYFSPMPNLIRKTFPLSSKAARTLRVVSDRFALMTAFVGDDPLVSMKSLSDYLPPHRSAFQVRWALLAIFKTFLTLSRGISIRSAISSGVGSRPISWTR